MPVIVFINQLKCFPYGNKRVKKYNGLNGRQEDCNAQKEVYFIFGLRFLLMMKRYVELKDLL